VLYIVAVCLLIGIPVLLEGFTVIIDYQTPSESNEWQMFFNISSKCTPYGATVISLVTLVLLVSEIYLIILLCKYFFKEMRREIFFLFLVQFFFVIGFIYRTVVEVRQWKDFKNSEVWTKESVQEKQLMWNINYFIYEGLPICAVYLHHTLNFRKQSKADSQSK